MRNAIALVLALAVSVCVRPRGFPTPQVPTGTGSTEWSAVVALRPGAYVFVTLGGGQLRQGLVRCASDTALVLYRFPADQTLDRAAVVRVAERAQTGTKPPRTPWYVGVPLAVAVFGGLVGMIVGAINRNDELAHAAGQTFGIGLGAAMGVGETQVSRPIVEDRLVYVRAEK